MNEDCIGCQQLRGKLQDMEECYDGEHERAERLRKIIEKYRAQFGDGPLNEPL